MGAPAPMLVPIAWVLHELPVHTALASKVAGPTVYGVVEGGVIPLQVTVYEVIGEPPSLAGAVQVTVSTTSTSEGVLATFVGRPGTVLLRREVEGSGNVKGAFGISELFKYCSKADQRQSIDLLRTRQE